MMFGNWNKLNEKLNCIDEIIFKSYEKDKLSDYEKRKIIFDYLCNHLSYDYKYLERLIKISKREVEDTYRNPYKEIESVIYNNIGVCNGIAQFYRILLELNGIYSLCVICDNGMEVGHQLNLVYDRENDSYSFDDVTSVIVGVDSADNLFDYDKEYASSIGQGNKRILDEEDGEWMFLTSEYIDMILGRKSDFSSQFGIDDGVNYSLPKNIKSIKDNEKMLM